MNNLICDTCKYRYKDEMCDQAKRKGKCPFINQHKDFAKRVEIGATPSRPRTAESIGTPLERELKTIVEREQSNATQ
jgi:hypothetical protein